MVGEEGGRDEEMEDVEELRQVLSVIAEFLDRLPSVLKQIFDAIYSRDTGEKVGESVASFYRKLSESGLPREVAIRMTEEFFDRSMVIDKLISQLASGAIGGIKSGEVERKIEEIGSAIGKREREEEEEEEEDEEEGRG